MTQDTLTRTSTTPSDAPEADSTTDAGSTPVVRTVGLERVHLTETLETAALGGVDLTIEDGEFVAVMGPSGSGKSTLLNILGLLDRPTGGRYELHGRDVTDLTARRRTDLRKEHMGFVFQAFNLIDELTVEENVEMPLLYHGMSVDARRQRIDELLARIGLDHRKRHFPKQLSGGQQQRVAVARAVATRPSLLLADEPTGNLDSVHGEQVMDLLTELHGDGATLIMVTHSEACAQRGTRLLTIRDGQLQAEH